VRNYTQLGYAEAFALGKRFETYCKMRGPNDPGEPKLADAFLKELARNSLFRAKPSALSSRA